MTEIEYEGRSYSFSWFWLIIFVPAIYITFTVLIELTSMLWWHTHEPILYQTVEVTNFLTNMGLYYVPVDRVDVHFQYIVPDRGPIGFETLCTGLQATAIFAGVIIFVPHSKGRTYEQYKWGPNLQFNLRFKSISGESKLTLEMFRKKYNLKYINKFLSLTKNRHLYVKDFDYHIDFHMWLRRKAWSLALSALLFHVVNILRMVLQLYMYYVGFAWNDIHVPIGAASSFIAGVIILLMHKWLPEFVLSLMWVSGDIRRMIVHARERRKETPKREEIVE